MAQAVTVLVGTTKGLFLLRGSGAGDEWQVAGPMCNGWPINHAIGKDGNGALWAGGGNEWFGALVWRSSNHGESWALSTLSNGQMDDWAKSDPETAKLLGMEPAGDAPFTGEIDAIWSLGLAGDRLFAGAKPGRLYASADDGES